jgi:hypothetical protein
VVGVAASTVLAIPTAWAGGVVAVALVIYLHPYRYLSLVLFV